MTAKRNSTRVRSKLCCLCIVPVALVFAGPVEAKAVYTILPLNTLVIGINDGGAVTGHYSDNGGFLRTPDGKITSFHVPGDVNGTWPGSINNDDTITGYDKDVNFVGHGFVRNAAGTIVTFDGPGAGNGGTIPMVINATGVIAGYCWGDSGAENGFIRAANGTITVFDVAHATDTTAMGINDNGAVAGYYHDQSGHYHGFVRNPQGKITTFDAAANSLLTWVYAINAKGVISGYFEDSGGVSHGYIRAANGTITAFDAPGTYTAPVGINASGETVGQFYVHNGAGQVGFIRKPGGAITSFRVPGAVGESIYESINTAGVVGGTAYAKSGQDYPNFGFIRTP